MASRTSREMHAESSPAEKDNLPAEAKGNDAPATMKHSEKAEGAEVPVLKEARHSRSITTSLHVHVPTWLTLPQQKTASLPVQSRVKKHSASARSSMEIFRSRKSHDDEGKGKQQGVPTSDSAGSIHTATSSDERRLSDKMKKAWRGVTGQKSWDPLEQWMIKHSGGALREVPAQQPPKEHPDGH